VEHCEGADWGLTKKADLLHLKKKALAQIPAYDLTTKHLVEHVRLRRQAGAGPSTVNNDLIWLGVIFKTARPAWGYDLNLQIIDDAKVVCRQTKLIGRAKERNRRPTIEELNQLLAHFADADGRATIPMVEVVLFQLFSARRDAETCRLRWDDLEGRTVLVRDMKHPTHKTDERVVLTPEAYLIANRQPREEGQPLIFPYNPRSVSAAFARGCKMCGIVDLRLHDLRHECASWLAELGWQIPQMAKVTGHKSWGTLKRYTHVDSTDINDKYEDWAWRPVLQQQLAVHQSTGPDR
jgi:integrase